MARLPKVFRKDKNDSPMMNQIDIPEEIERKIRSKSKRLREYEKSKRKYQKKLMRRHRLREQDN